MSVNTFADPSCACRVVLCDTRAPSTCSFAQVVQWAPAGHGFEIAQRHASPALCMSVSMLGSQHETELRWLNRYGTCTVVI